jgi:acyl-CoA synthetase (AMP-forming)/AMP-acid ligase II
MTKPFHSLAEVFRWRAEHQPERWCYSFLRDGEADEQRVTYAEVHDRASAVAALLTGHAAPGERALLVLPPSLDFAYAFVGCLYAGVVAVPLAAPHPLRLGRAAGRLRAVAVDCGAEVALTTAALRAAATSAEGSGLPSLEWLAVDETPGSPAPFDPGEAEPGDLAFLQYTSGATGRPKGVMVTHENVLANEAMIARAFESTPDAVGVGWLPFHHDMGLIGNLLHPPFAGYPVVLLPPLSVLQQPRRWLQAISRYRATVSGGPDFAFDLCARRVNGPQAPDLDLSSWNVAFSGAEPVRADTLARFAAAFAEQGFRRSAFLPCYGLAEATLMVTAAGAARPEVYTGPGDLVRVDCGTPLLEEEVRVVDPVALRECGAGAVGEVWVRGRNVTPGYWNRPDETLATFGARLADGSGPWLRTGDLGFMENGHLFIEGRLKDVVIVRGRNHHPEDLELSAARASAAIQPAAVAAFGVEGERGEELVVAAEIDPRSPEPHGEIAALLRAALVEEHGVAPVAVALLPRGALLRTTSGKLRRRATAAAFRKGSLPVLAVFRSTAVPELDD